MDAPPSIEMPRYKCHKEVYALRIAVVTRNVAEISGLRVHQITPEDDRYAPFAIDDAYLAKHNPKPGGYYVVYLDGYKSFSPAEAFESGYTLIGGAP